MKKVIPFNRHARAMQHLFAALEEYHGEKFTLDDFDLIEKMLKALPKEDYSRVRLALIVDEAFCRNHGKEPGIKPEWFMH